LSITNPVATSSAAHLNISYNNIAIVRFLPTTLESRFDTYIDSNELDTVKDFDIEDPNFMRYIVKVGLTKNDILSIIEKLAYRHNYASMGTSYYIDDELTLNNYGYGMSEFIYWLYSDMTKDSKYKLGVFDYSTLDMQNTNTFTNNNRFIESTIKLIRKFYIENTLVNYNGTHGDDDRSPTFSYMDNIASKSDGLTSNTRYANDPNNTYVYPALQDYRFDVIYATYNLTNLTTNGRTIINPGETEYSFYLYSLNGSILPRTIWIKIDGQSGYLVDGSDYFYNYITGQVTIYSITKNFTVTAIAERVSKLEITKDPNKTLYYTTEKFDPTGMVVTVRWTNGKSEVVPRDQYTFSHYDELLTTDITEIEIYYRDSDYFDYSDKVPITVRQATDELVYVLSPNRDYYTIGLEYDEESEESNYGSGLSAIPEDGVVVIPDTIINPESGLAVPVRVIADNAFRELDISSVSFGANIGWIKENAFNSCNATSITLNSNLSEIDDGAFANCPSLTGLTIPSSVTIIGTGVLMGSTALEHVGISTKMTGLPQNMFKGCTALLSIEIPNNITAIGYECFSGCTSLAIVDISNTSKLNSIGEKAFYGCSNLVSIRIPTNAQMTMIKANTFAGSGLVTLRIPNNITIVEDTAFANCIALESVVFEIPSGSNTGISTLGQSIFSGCLNLVNVDIGFEASVDKCVSTDIAWFAGCNTALSIKVPKTVYDEDESLDDTAANYGTYWNYIDAGHNATYYSGDTPS